VVKEGLTEVTMRVDLKEVRREGTTGITESRRLRVNIKPVQRPWGRGHWLLEKQEGDH
jgi:hypothetical protein